MKTKLLVLFMLLSIGGSLEALGMKVFSVDVADKREVSVKREDGYSWDTSNGPRSQDIYLVTCQYEDETVYLNFLANIGWVELTVTNLSTGDTWNTTQLSTLGSLSLQTSTDSGNYKVEIKTELDGNYIGYFIR